MSGTRLSEPMKQLLREVETGEARYVKQYSRYQRTLSALVLRGLVSITYIGMGWVETALTTDGAAVLGDFGVGSGTQ